MPNAEGKLNHETIRGNLSLTEELFWSDRGQISALLSKIPYPFAVCRIMVDEKQKPKDFVYVVANEKNEEVVACKKRDIIGKKFSEIYPVANKDASNWIDLLGQVALTGKPIRLEWYLSRKNKWYSIFAFSPRKDYFGVISEDITKRKKAEEALRQSEKRFHQLTTHSPDTIYLLNTKTFKITYRNRQTFLGYSRSELQSPYLIMHAVHPDDRLLVQSYWQQVLLGTKEGKRPIEYRVKSKEGAWDWIQSRATTIKFDENGKPEDIIVTLSIITERKKSEEALRDSEERFRIMADGTPSMLWITDAEGKNVFVNKCYKEFFNVTFQQANGKKWQPLLHPEDIPQYIGTFSEANRHHKPFFAQARVKRADGQWRWIESNAEPRFSRDGEFLGHVGISVDITERKKTEEAFKESEAKFRSLVESTSDWIWQIDNNAVYTYVSPKVKDILGYEPEEVLGKTPFDLMPKEEAKKIAKIFSQIAKKKISFRNLENLAVHKNGRIVPLETSGVPIEDEKGNLTGYRGIDRDITERKKAQDALRESEELYRTLFDNSDDGFILVEPLYDENDNATDFRFLKVNSAYERQTGRKAAVVEGKRAKEIAPDLEQEWISLCGRVAKAGKSLRIENYNSRTSKWYDAHYFPFVKGRVGILFTDVTERKNLERQLKEKERLAAIGQTAGMVGHDIRNPLQAMMGDVYLLKNYLSDITATPIKTDITESIEGVEKNIGYINKIIADLQDYARPLKPEYSYVNISELLESVFKTIELPNNIKLSTNIEKFTAKTEPTFIRRALTNLINNAVQAMPNGGKLEVTCFQDKQNIHINVSDTGTGIPEEIKPKLFTPMITTKAKGQGLGLAVVKRLVEALNGRITFESQQGKGTKFNITLPTTQ